MDLRSDKGVSLRRLVSTDAAFGTIMPRVCGKATAPRQRSRGGSAGAGFAFPTGE